MNRERKGSERLACSYSVKGKSGEVTVVGYFQFVKGEYLMDSEREIWPE